MKYLGGKKKEEERKKKEKGWGSKESAKSTLWPLCVSDADSWSERDAHSLIFWKSKTKRFRIRRSGAKAKRFSSASRLIEPSGAQRTTEKGNERARSVTLKKRRSCRRRPLLFACLTCSSLRERERERERTSCSSSSLVSFLKWTSYYCAAYDYGATRCTTLCVQRLQSES